MFALLFFIAHVTLSGNDSKFLPIYILPPPPPPEKEYKIYLDRVACFVKRIQDKNLAIFTNIELQVQCISKRLKFNKLSMCLWSKKKAINQSWINAPIQFSS